MPFTGSHPAAVLPLLRTGLPASALVAGSLAPDLPYYLPLDLGVRTHTALAVVTTDLLLGALLWAVWHGLLSTPALAWAPGSLAARLPATAAPGLRRRLRTPGRAVRVLAAVPVGAATHVLWDEFTHPGRWGAEHVPALAATWAGEAGYSWAQDLSGAGGALVLAGWLALWWRRTPSAASAGSRPHWWLPWTVLAAAAGAAGAAAAAGAPDLRSGAVWAAFAGGGAALGVAVVLALTWTAYGYGAGRAARR
ncbi:uncharacterized protein DUF4184 [Geodermatophilus normandii]|uniref:Uncharacterized protein DUF4184 n=1 Tax=Geodermatophilus normandii TaxID=1137989 RepID=A0A317QG11_9ACTN|nr:DUF4184 family protein [Geodermatophilus normandii]PWW22628.1 uncharacterized protein DUF4184 [Geodermatophilus normandii]